MTSQDDGSQDTASQDDVSKEEIAPKDTSKDGDKQDIASQYDASEGDIFSIVWGNDTSQDIQQGIVYHHLLLKSHRKRDLLRHRRQTLPLYKLDWSAFSWPRSTWKFWEDAGVQPQQYFIVHKHGRCLLHKTVHVIVERQESSFDSEMLWYSRRHPKNPFLLGVTK